MATHSRTGSGRRKRRSIRTGGPRPDLNMIAAGLLHDMAALQGNRAIPVRIQARRESGDRVADAGRRSRGGGDPPRGAVHRPVERPHHHRARRDRVVDDCRCRDRDVRPAARRCRRCERCAVISSASVAMQQALGQPASRGSGLEGGVTAATFRCTRRGAMAASESRRWRRPAWRSGTPASASPTTPTACRLRAG